MQTQASPAKMVFSCSGAADVGEIADRAARQLQREGIGKMFCLAGVGGRVPDMLERTRAAGQIVVIDGCEKDCGKHCLAGAGIESFGHVRVTDLGMEKGKSPVNEQRINIVAGRVSGVFSPTAARSPVVTQNITDAVRSKYGAVAESDLSNEHRGVRAVAQAFGYSAEELASIPAAANMGLSCGNPTAMASLKPGEVVVDLGCGGGLDVFLAAQKVGLTGKAIGIDMTPAMIERARKNAAGIRNVEFHLATIDQLPLPDASVDCVISNCVINLAPDKAAVFREIARVLKPGGRLAVSDIALKQPLPEELRQSVAALVGCIAGAIPIEEYRRGLTAAGFAGVQVVDSGTDLNAYAKVENQAGCCSPAMEADSSRGADSPGKKGSACCSVPVACCGEKPAATSAVHAGMKELLKRYDVNAYAASVKVFAVKP